MKEPSPFSAPLKEIATGSSEPFVRDSERMISYCFEPRNIPERYGWRFSDVAAIKKQVEGATSVCEVNRIYWLDQARNIEAYSLTTFWRGTELIEPAIRSLNERELLPAAVLSRSCLELAAAFISNANIIEDTLRSILQKHSEFPERVVVTSTELEERIVKMIWGTRLGKPEPHLEQTNILTVIDKLTKLPNARELRSKYDYLCELAHPNVIGNALFWSHVERVNDDGSETRVMMKRHEDGITRQVTENSLWALAWSAACLRNGLELTRAAIAPLVERLNRPVA